MDPLAEVDRALARGRRAALVTVTGITGSPPAKPGLRLAVTETGTAFGTLGCDGFDRSGTADALRAIETGEPFTNRYAWDERSLITVEVRPFRTGDRLPDTALRAPELLVVGTGPVARALIAFGRLLGFRVRVAAGPGAPTPGEFDGADEVVHAPDARAVRGLALGPDTHVVICGHDEEFSQPALRALLESDAAYLGMMGSRRHTGHLLDELRAAGVAENRLRRVHSPVGIDIGAENPEEIALAALAQIVAERRGRTGRPLDAR